MTGSTEGTEWMGCPEAARQVGVTTRTLYRIIDQGELPAYRIGRVIRLRRLDVATWLEAQRLSPGDLRHLHDPASDSPSTRPSSEDDG